MTDKMLAYFAAAQRTGSFSTAAWELSATQQAVSYGIKKLEEELGFPLFVRRASRVELTAGGQAFRAWYEALDREAARLAAEEPARVPAGSVTDTQVRCFLAAAREGSVVTAAASLYYAPQTLAEHLTALEAALGVSLLRRKDGVCTLTPAGEAYRQVFESAAAALAALRTEAGSQYDSRLNTAVLGLSEWLSTDGPLGEALDAFPGNVKVEVLSNTDLLAALESGRADVALWSEGHAPVNRGFETTPLGREDICLFLPEEDGPCPLLVCPGWPRSYLENRAIVTQETRFGSFTPSRILQAEDVGQMRELLAQGSYAAVGDRRFGSLAPRASLRAVPLGIESSLVACRRTNEGDCCAARLVIHLRASLVGGTK